MPRMLASRMDSMARQFLISLKPRLGEVGSPKLRPLEVGAQKPRPLYDKSQWYFVISVRKIVT